VVLEDLNQRRAAQDRPGVIVRGGDLRRLPGLGKRTKRSRSSPILTRLRLLYSLAVVLEGSPDVCSYGQLVLLAQGLVKVIQSRLRVHAVSLEASLDLLRSAALHMGLEY
jgi:hypothetical protein